MGIRHRGGGGRGRKQPRKALSTDLSVGDPGNGREHPLSVRGQRCGPLINKYLTLRCILNTTFIHDIFCF